MAIRECRSGHVVTDDGLDFCPECRAGGASVLLGPPRSGVRLPTAADRHDHAGSSVGLLLVSGILVATVGLIIVAAASTNSAQHVGWFLVVLGGIPIGIGAIAIAVALGIRMSREQQARTGRGPQTPPGSDPPA